MAIIKFDDAEIKVVVATTTAWPGELLLIAFVEVSADERHASINVANLLAVGRNDTATWLLSPTPEYDGDSSSADDSVVGRLQRQAPLEDLWQRVTAGDIAEEDVLEPATAGRILDLAVEAIETSASSAPTQSRRW
ncbi:hypothetical protein [Dactylosporangium sp. CA-139066]|uniref:hypothetical protein n=1 Tax=Dactylosporangium sp. CA-139066 TaxID=3239930 RepID=UPI003D8F6F2A